MGLGSLGVGPSFRTDNRLVAYYGESFGINNGSKTISSNASKTGELAASLGWKFNNLSLGGPNSVYGLIPNGKFAKREFDTRNEDIQIKKNLGTEIPGGATHLPDDFERYFAPYTIFSQYGRRSGVDEGGIIIKAPDSTNKEAFDETRSPTERTQQERTENLYYRHEAYINKDYKKDIYKFGGGGIPKSTQTDGAKYIGTNAKGEDLSYARAAGEIITDYETISYINIPKRKSGAGADIDFRSLLTEDSNEYKRAFDKDGESIYEKQNINTRVGFGKPGLLGPNEDRVRWWNTSPESVNFLNRFDKVNAAEPGAADVNDLVHLWFKADGGQKVQFRGTVAGITDTFSPSWNPVKYNGRADQAYNYSTFERSLSFNFKVMATSRVEMKPIWNKLSYLSTMTMPKYGGDDGYQGTLIYFRLGSLYNNKLAFIESLSYSISDEVSWEISPKGTENSLGEIPKMIDVSITLKILGNSRPTVGESSGVYEADFLTKSEELKAEEQTELEDVGLSESSDAIPAS